MRTVEFLSFLRGLDIRIWADGDGLGYNAPEGVLTPDLKSELVKRKGEILAYLRSAATLASIEPVPRDRELPASFAQERLWFLDQLEQGSTAYNLPMTMRLLGPLDVGALVQSLNEIVRRHEALRTTFSAPDGRPVQVIGPNLPLSLPVVDLQGLPAADREAEARRLAAREADQPFSLDEGPLLRSTLLRLDERDHVLVLVVHHIVSDGWSMVILRRELAVLYEAYVAGKSSPLPELPIQYADYAVWQREWLQGEVLETELEYWRHELDDAPHLLALPTTRPRPPIQTYRGATKSFLLPSHLTGALKQLGREEEASLFMTLLAAWNVLLCRYSGQEDIIVGSPISGRDQIDTEGLIGFFLKTLVLRTDLSDDPDFLQLLRRVREKVLGAFDHQLVPFGQLLAELQPERSLSHAPLFQVLFVLQEPLTTRRELPGLTMYELELEHTTAILDLSLYLRETAEGLWAGFEYSTDLFDAPTIDRMAGHFETLLESIVADPRQPISRLQLLTEGERRQLLVDWNDTAVDYPQDGTIHGLFEAQAERTPDSLALVFGTDHLNYAGLNTRANQLAHYLQRSGVGPGVLVGVCMERSAQMVVALIAVLKAGGAFIPLDPGDPRTRQAFIVDDARASVLLTLSELQPTLSDHGAKVVCLDSDWSEISRETVGNPSSQVGGEDVAYVIYTSGSTGQPKGVLALHRGAVNRFSWMWTRYPFEEGEVCCQKTALSFVDSVWEIFGPLLQGVPLVIIPDDVVKDPESLIEALGRHSVTRIGLVPSLLRVLLETDSHLGRRLPKLRFWVSSGEALPVSLVRQFRELMPQATLLNLYGSSEVSADVTHYDTSPVQADWPSVPIGRPIANTQIYILDRQRMPVPVGVHGEIYVGGSGLAKGYLHRPELDQAKFVANPFRDNEERLYRTGDLARYSPDGIIEYLGRVDHQIKIRGIRVELEEIETVLSEHAEVGEAVVSLRAEAPGDERLVAYLVPSGKVPPNRGELRDYLRAKLPAYMLPSQYVTLEAIPLTASGKADRRALPAPDWSRSQVEQAFVAPRTPAEEALASIWTRVLGIERIGVYDDFFDLGGHSLIATRVVAHVREDLQVKLSLRSLFESPTVAALARLVEIAQWAAQNASDRLQPTEEIEEGEL